jgi:hypothetical protein
MNQSKFGSYYDSTRNARPYTNSYGGSNQNVDEYDDYDRWNDDFEDIDHVYASDDYDDENLDERDDYYGRYTDGRETGSYNNYGRLNAQRNNFGYGNYSGRSDYGYRDQHTLPRYNSGTFSGYGGSNYKGITYGRSYTGYSNSGQDNDYPSRFDSKRDSNVLNQSNGHGCRRRRQGVCSY